MKKITLVIIFLSGLIVMTSCGKSDVRVDSTFDLNIQNETISVSVGTISNSEVKNENWVSASSYTEAMAILLNMYIQNMDYRKACSKEINSNTVSTALKEWKSCGGGYLITESMDAYLRINKKEIDPREDEKVVCFYGMAKEIPSHNDSGYAIIRRLEPETKDPETGKMSSKYVIKEIRFRN